MMRKNFGLYSLKKDNGNTSIVFSYAKIFIANVSGKCTVCIIILVVLPAVPLPHDNSCLEAQSTTGPMSKYYCLNVIILMFTVLLNRRRQDYNYGTDNNAYAGKEVYMRAYNKRQHDIIFS